SGRSDYRAVERKVDKIQENNPDRLLTAHACEAPRGVWQMRDALVIHPGLGIQTACQPGAHSPRKGMNAVSHSPGRVRLDELLVARGAFQSRSRARDAIERGTVRVDGQIAAKAGKAVPESAVIEIDDPARPYVSRAALKLVAGLDHFGLDPN